MKNELHIQKYAADLEKRIAESKPVTDLEQNKCCTSNSM